LLAQILITFIMELMNIYNKKIIKILYTRKKYKIIIGKQYIDFCITNNIDSSFVFYSNTYEIFAVNCFNHYIPNEKLIECLGI
jgi:hypothetical protein